MSRVKVTNIVQIESENNLGSNSFSCEISGKGVDSIFTNTIIRTIISLCGSYSYNQDNIEIPVNTSDFNNDYMRLRLSNIPIIYKDYMYDTIDNYAETCVDLEKKRKKVIGARTPTDVEIMEEKNIQKAKLINNIHMHVDAKNNGNDILDVTTNNKYTTFYKDGEVIPDIYPREVMIIGLKPGQEIKFTTVADFNIPANSSIYASAIKPGHRHLPNDSWQLNLTSYRQIPERRIVIEACKIIIIKINNVKDYILEKINSLKNTTDIDYSAEIELVNENHTVGEILSRRIRMHNNSKFAGFVMKHPDINNILLEYKTEGATFTKVLQEVVQEIINDYTVIITKLS